MRKSSGMPRKIILVQANVGRSAVDLLATACLPLPTVKILADQISRAQEPRPSEPILVNLADVQHLDTAALEQLRVTEPYLTGKARLRSAPSAAIPERLLTEPTRGHQRALVPWWGHPSPAR